MKKKTIPTYATAATARFHVDLVTRLRFSHIWHNNLFAFADRPSSFATLEAAEAEAEYRNQSDGIDIGQRPETFWQVRD